MRHAAVDQDPGGWEAEQAGSVEVAERQDRVEHEGGFVFESHPREEVLDSLVGGEGCVLVGEAHVVGHGVSFSRWP